MKNRYVYIAGIVGITILFVVAFYFLFLKTPYDASDMPTFSNNVSVFIGESEIFPDRENLLIENSLSPEITIRHSRKLKIEEVVFDSKISLLSETSLLEGIKISRDSDRLKMALPFLISPTLHNIDVKVADQENQPLNQRFFFLLGIKNEFNKSIDDSDFFILPETTKSYSPESWQVIDGKLKATPPTAGHASLAFIYPFKDVFASFRLTPNEGSLNLVFYFLESGRSIVIGNGDNKRITLLRGYPYLDVAIDGKPFVLEPHKTYTVSISREKAIYRVYIAEAKNENNQSPTPNLLFEFDDSGNVVDRENSIGLAIWQGSGGFEIDELIISAFDHFQYVEKD